MKSIIVTIVLGLFFYSSFSQANELSAIATELEIQFNNEWNSNNKAQACVTAVNLTTAYRILITTVMRSNQSDTTEGKTAIKSLVNRIEHITSLCPLTEIDV